MGARVDVLCDLRVAFGETRDQGSRPTCLAFALSDAHSAARGVLEQLSVEHLYYHAVARTPGGHPDDGVALSAAQDALRIDGQSVEADWPYLPAVPSTLSKWKPPASAARVYTRDTHLTTPKVADVIARLDLGRPVVMVMMLGERFYKPIDGLVRLGLNDADTDLHAVIAVGHGECDNGDQCVLVRNSWGDDWALEGYAWISAPYLESRLRCAVIMNV